MTASGEGQQESPNAGHDVGANKAEDLTVRLSAPAPNDTIYVYVMDQIGKGNQEWLNCEITKGLSCFTLAPATLAGRTPFSIYIMEQSGNYAVPAEDVLVSYDVVSS